MPHLNVAAAFALLQLLLLAHALEHAQPTLEKHTALPPSATRAVCIEDYDPCGGGVLAPVRPIPCCTDNFYCYTRGPYFSQCRPLRELSRRTAPTPAPPPPLHPAPPRLTRSACARAFALCDVSAQSAPADCCDKRYVCVPTGTGTHGVCRAADPVHRHAPERENAPFCGVNYGVCAAGTSADSHLQCCDDAFHCVPAGPLYWQCVPVLHTAADTTQHVGALGVHDTRRSWWVILPWLRRAGRPGGAVQYTYQTARWAEGVGARRVRSYEKMESFLAPNGTLRMPRVMGACVVVGVLPVLEREELATLVQAVSDAVEYGDVSARQGQLVVRVRENSDEMIAKAAMTLALFPQVARVELLE